MLVKVCRSIQETLDAIEKELQRLELWELEPPSLVALASSAPFAVDTLNFTQWLQFIFIPRLRVMINAGTSLPSSCSITPMAEEYFSGSSLSVNNLITYLRHIDQLLTKGLLPH